MVFIAGSDVLSQFQNIRRVYGKKGKGDWVKYYGYKSEEESLLTPAQHWSKTLGIKDATVYRISGFNVQKYEVHNDFETGSSTKTNIDPAEKVEEDKLV
ncbi:hypothetical protein Trydic_g22183 [Trypoxylus dichotomus]